MGVFRRRAERAQKHRANAIEFKRWSWVVNPLDSTVERVATTPAWVLLGPGRAAGGHVLLTGDAMYIAVTQDPIGSETRPFVLTVPLSDISRLGVTADGLLYMENHDSRGALVSNLLDLYPSPLSQLLLAELRTRWMMQANRDVEGDWDQWLGDYALQANRSPVTWTRR